jgi:hypothetical protein
MLAYWCATKTVRVSSGATAKLPGLIPYRTAKTVHLGHGLADIYIQGTRGHSCNSLQGILRYGLACPANMDPLKFFYNLEAVQGPARFDRSRKSERRKKKRKKSQISSQKGPASHHCPSSARTLSPPTTTSLFRTISSLPLKFSSKLLISPFSLFSFLFFFFFFFLSSRQSSHSASSCHHGFHGSPHRRRPCWYVLRCFASRASFAAFLIRLLVCSVAFSLPSSSFLLLSSLLLFSLVASLMRCAARLPAGWAVQR